VLEVELEPSPLGQQAAEVDRNIHLNSQCLTTQWTSYEYSCRSSITVQQLYDNKEQW